MINELIQVFDVAMDAPVATRYGIAMGRPAVVQVNGAEHTIVVNDKNGPMSYWRVDTVRSNTKNTYTPRGGVQYTVPLRVVLVLKKDCAVHELLTTMGSRLRGAVRAAKQALDVMLVETPSITEVTNVGKQEGVDRVPLQHIIVALDITVLITSSVHCLPTCGEAPDILCALLAKASDQQIADCLGGRLQVLCATIPVQTGAYSNGYSNGYDI
jgi:hypothetical protein